MAIEIPDDWPPSGWVESPPIAHLDTVVANPEELPGPEPLRWSVAQWSTTREIAASSLPGQVRAKTGLSIGTGRALIKREPDDFPWKKRATYELTGQNAQLLIAPEGGTKIPTGQFQVAEISGDISTLGVQVDLDEKTIEGRDKAANVRGWDIYAAKDMPDGVVPVDPSWWISELAKQIGYGNGSLIPGVGGYTPILDVPMQGSLTPAYPAGLAYQTTDTIAWGELGGSVALTTELDNQIVIVYPNTVTMPQTFVVTLDLGHGEHRTRWDGTTTLDRFQLALDVNSASNAIFLNISSVGSNGNPNTATSISIPNVLRDPDNPNRVQAEVTFTSGAATYTAASVRVRRDADAAWSAPLVHTMTNTLNQGAEYVIVAYLFPGAGGSLGKMSHYSIFSGSATVVNLLMSTTEGENGRLYLEPLLGTITSPWLAPDLTTWNAMQEIVEAWQGALITDVYGDLRLMNRRTLTGVGTGQEIPIDVGLKFEDLPWIANHTDQADRLVVRYRPARLVRVNGFVSSTLPVVWEAQDIIPAPPGVSEIFVQPEYLYLMYSNLPFYRKDFANGIYNEWDGFQYSNGSGTHIAQDTEAHARLEPVTTSTWKVRWTNFTSSTYYLVDSSGTPWLKIRSGYHMDQTQEAVIERGVTAGEAKNPLEIDLSNYVQNEADANALADFIWKRVNHRAWRANTINAVPDYQLDLGDVVEITHARTGVRSNALVTKVNLEGQPGQVTQKIDLILIPPTWEDFDEAWAAYTPNPPGSWAEFDALWDDYTWVDFDRTPTATTVAEIEEAL